MNSIKDIISIDHIIETIWNNVQKIYVFYTTSDPEEQDACSATVTKGVTPISAVTDSTDLYGSQPARPFATIDGYDAPKLFDELVPSLAGMVDDVVAGFEGLVPQQFVAHEPADDWGASGFVDRHPNQSRCENTNK